MLLKFLLVSHFSLLFVAFEKIIVSATVVNCHVNVLMLYLMFFGYDSIVQTILVVLGCSS